ncbi:Hypothetical predicted protein [Olea europaea subsp. europaea]|uniref:Uncharacterized protein n=1 Tax=Olea europaea subsp. europaea TaxID=158383 RepID=A0A8S0PG65_OLEEU|nr:Hypothetical predicted protein [Olea europaea subsp. europaea]
MSSTKEEIAPRQTKECLDEEASLQNTLIVQEPLLDAPAIHYRRGGSMSKSRLVARLDRHMQGQLANSLQNNEESVSAEKELGVGMVANYAAHQMTEEIAVPPNYSRVVTLMRMTSVFDRLGLTRNRQDRSHILPAQIKLFLIPFRQSHLFDPPSVGVSIDNINRKPQLTQP